MNFGKSTLISGYWIHDFENIHRTVTSNRNTAGIVNMREITAIYRNATDFGVCHCLSILSTKLRNMITMLADWQRHELSVSYINSLGYGKSVVNVDSFPSCCCPVWGTHYSDAFVIWMNCTRFVNKGALLGDPKAYVLNRLTRIKCV